MSGTYSFEGLQKEFTEAEVVKALKMFNNRRFGRVGDQDHLVCTRFDGVCVTSIYFGGFDSLHNITDSFDWRHVCNKESGYEADQLTLQEITDQLKAKGISEHCIITVFVDEPMHTAIYQYGNYPDGYWYKIGDGMGYA